MGVARKPAWWKARIQELEAENKKLMEDVLRVERRKERLEDEIRELHREMREQDREWLKRLGEAMSASNKNAEENLGALDAALDEEEEPEPEAEAKAVIGEYIGFMNGGESEAPIYWAKDYIERENEEAPDGGD